MDVTAVVRGMRQAAAIDEDSGFNPMARVMTPGFPAQSPPAGNIVLITRC
jgi:hypothetical protein